MSFWKLGVVSLLGALGCSADDSGAAAEAGTEDSGGSTGRTTSAATDAGESEGSADVGENTAETGTSIGTGDDTGGDDAPVAWQLDEGHYYAAVMDPVVIYPRPDSEVGEWARHRWAHPGVEFRIPAAVVQGGAWPFLYELVDGPPGATVGQTLEWEGDRMVAGADYGVVSWTPPDTAQGSTVDFHIRVTDQEGTTVDAQWTTTVDSERFVFVAMDGDDAADGSIDDPLATASGWYRDEPSDATYADHLVYFRGGNYAPRGAPDNNNNFRMEAGVKPMSIMGFPGEDVTFDATGSSWTFQNGTNDVYFSGIHFNGSKLEQPDGAPIRNARMIGFYGTSNHQRITFFDNRVSNIEPGNPLDDSFGNDNPAFVWRPSTGAVRGEYWAFVNNEFETAGPRTSNGPSCVSLSCVSHVVYENNRVVAWAGTGTFFDKANNDYVTQRNNDLWLVGTRDGSLGHGLGAGMSGSYDPDHRPGYFETCWNRIQTPNTGVSQLAVQVGLSADPDNGPVWLYRNSIRGNVAFVRIDRFEATADRNVIQGEYVQQGADVVGAGDNYENADWTAEVFDAQGWLAGEAADVVGTHGADVR
ncbi:MAG: hypothetical protein JKY37_08885 [Nannocystaceae bacterium]|nr:hypothetical protein [Nannocystaceae bacterium]